MSTYLDFCNVCDGEGVDEDGELCEECGGTGQKEYDSEDDNN